MRRLLGALALSVVCASCVGSQGCGERPGAAGSTAEAKLEARPAMGKPDLRLVALTDLSGYLVPCGCQSRPLGGIDKAAAQLAELRAGGVPTLLVAAGDLLFGELPDGAQSAEQAATQETWKAEALVGIFDELELVAAAPGPRDLSYGVDTLARLDGLGRVQLLPAAPAASDARENVARGRAHAGGYDVGLVGVSTFTKAGEELDTARERALIARAQTEADAAKKAGASVVVVLASASQRFGRRLAGALRGVDFVVLGGSADGADSAPSRVGEAHLLRARSQGHGLLVVDLFLPKGAAGPFTDVSAWTRRKHDEELRGRIDELSSRIATWEKDPSIDKADLAEQKKKLGALQSEHASASAFAASGRRFDARFVELGPEVSGAAAISARIAAYDARVNDHNRVAFAEVLPPTAAPGTASYAGSDSCKSCHAGAYAWWRGHKHGVAYDTLVAVNKQYNLSCVACHVTGYMRPGGSSLVHNQGLVHVGCESCHGPGSEHVAHPDDEPARGMTKDPAADVCTQCHNSEHSDKFEYVGYRARLLAPGHGMPEAKP